MVKSVAVIGVGAMGAPMARRILAAGYTVTVCDTSEQALAPFADSPATVTGRASHCNASDLVLVLVATGEQVRDVLIGRNGLISGLDQKRPPLVGIMSTVGSETMRDLEQSLAPLGIHLIDAPISGGAVRAEEGSLTLIVAGEESDIAIAKPVLECLGRELFHCGPVGVAQTVKIANNILAMVNTLTAAEVYRLVLDHDLTLAAATPIFDASSGRNWLSANPDEAARLYATFARTRHSFDSVMAVIRKDASLGLELRSRSGGSFPVIEQMTALVESLGDETFETWRTVGAVAERSS